MTLAFGKVLNGITVYKKSNTDSEMTTMFHEMSDLMKERMNYLELIDKEDRINGTPRSQRLDRSHLKPVSLLHSC